jgi:hypothetical protein
VDPAAGKEERLPGKEGGKLRTLQLLGEGTLTGLAFRSFVLFALLRPVGKAAAIA